MPWRDGTGPLGRGPLTGRGLGPCGRGLGFRRGFGMGFGSRYVRPVALTEAEEKKILETELKEIENEKQAIEKRLKEMK
jgi:hypothetical protein